MLNKCRSRPVSRVLSRGRSSSAAYIPLGRALPRVSSERYPEAGAGRPSLALRRDSLPICSCTRWGLPCRLRHRRRGALLPHRFTLATHPSLEGPFGGLFSVALSCGSPRPVVDRHPALWCPDFPRRPLTSRSTRTPRRLRRPRCNTRDGGRQRGRGPDPAPLPPQEPRDALLRAERLDRAPRARGRERLARPPPVPDEELVPLRPARLGEERHEVLLHLRRVGLAREPEPSRHAPDVRVHRERVRGAEVDEHDAGGFRPDARQALERLARPRHASAVMLGDDLHRGDDRLRLVPVEAEAA